METERQNKQHRSTSFKNIFQPKRKGDDLVYKKGPKNPSISIFTCFLISLNINFGIDPFYSSNGYCLGVWRVVLGLIVMFVINILCYFLYLKCWIYGQIHSLNTAWEYTVSRSLSWLPDLLVFFSFFYWTSGSCIESVNTLSIIVSHFNPSPPSFVLSPIFITYVVSSIFCCSIIFMKELHHMRFFSYLGILSVIAPLILIIYALVLNINDNPKFDISKNLKQTQSSFGELLHFLIHLFGLIGNISIVEHIVQFIYKPTFSRVNITYITSSTASFVIIFLYGLIGFMLIGSQRSAYNILFTIYDDGVALTIALIFYFIYVIITMISSLWIMARHLTMVFAKGWEIDFWTNSKWLPHIFACLTVIALNASMIYAKRFILDIIETIGDVSFLLIGLVLPSVFYTRMFSAEKMNVWYFLSWFFIILGMAAVLFAILYKTTLI